jgi:hypothetical protein
MPRRFFSITRTRKSGTISSQPEKRETLEAKKIDSEAYKKCTEAETSSAGLRCLRRPNPTYICVKERLSR